MAPQTGTALLIIGAFVLPGFITLLIRERTYWVKGKDTPFERLLNSLYYSSIIYAVLGVVALIAGLDRDEISRLYDGLYAVETYLLLAFTALLVLPFAIAELGRHWQKSRRLRPWVLKRAGIDLGHGVPAGWEQLFLESPGANAGHGLMLRVSLADGRVVGGFFGEESLAGYTAHTRDLFIEERWTLDDDGWFKAPVDGSYGLWVSEDQIHSVEVYAPLAPGAQESLQGGRPSS